MNIGFNTRLLNIQLILDKVKIKDGQKVADLGCGKFGHFAFAAAKLVGNRGQAYAVDVIKENLIIIDKEAKRNNISNLSTIWSDLELLGATKIKEQFLDLVFLVNILHENQQPFKIINEALRLLKIGGKILIVDWQPSASPFGPKNRLDKNLLLTGCKKLGLHLEDDFNPGQYHYALLFTKP